MKMVYKIIDWVLLGAILLMLLVIYFKMPPTVGDMASAKTTSEKQRINSKRPLVIVGGTVTADIPFTVDVNVENEPLSVEIWR